MIIKGNHKYLSPKNNKKINKVLDHFDSLPRTINLAKLSKK